MQDPRLLKESSLTDSLTQNSQIVLHINRVFTLKSSNELIAEHNSQPLHMFFKLLRNAFHIVRVQLFKECFDFLFGLGHLFGFEIVDFAYDEGVAVTDLQKSKPLGVKIVVGENFE